MHYLIDFDSRAVQCKSAEREPLETYIQDNSLEMAVFIASESDDIEMEMSIEEMNCLYIGLFGDSEGRKPNKFESEQEASEACFSLMEWQVDSFPKYTAALGKKLLKEGEADSKIKTASPAKVKKTVDRKAEAKVPGKHIRLKDDDVIIITDAEVLRSGSILATIVTAISEEMCSTVKEISDYVVANHVMPRTGKPADDKYARHNISYFIKQGRLEIEEL